MPLPGRELSSINFESMLGGPLVAVINAQAKAAMSSVNFIKAVGFEAAGTPDKPATGQPIYVKFKYKKVVTPGSLATKEVNALALVDGGGGYAAASPPSVTISGGGGQGATATATVDAGGKVALVLVEKGEGYTAAPTVIIGAPPAGAVGAKQATATAALGDVAAVAAVLQDMQLEVPILTMLPIPFIRIEETTIDFNAKINSVEETTTDEKLSVKTATSGKAAYPPLFSVASVSLKVSTAFQKNTQTGSKVDRTYSMQVHIRAVQDEMPAGMERILGILEDSIVSNAA